MNTKSLLKKVPVFSGITNNDVNIIAKSLIKKKYPKGAHLFKENEEGKSLYVIIHGLVKIYTADKSGRLKTLAYLKDGDFFGEMAMLDQEKRSASALVIEDAEVFALSRGIVKKILLDNPQIALKLLKALSVRLRYCDKQIEDLTFRNLPGRVASALLDLAAKYGVKTPAGVRLNLKLTHQDLADIVGTAREVVTSVLGDFRESGCVEDINKHILIVNANELRSWIT